MKKLLSGCLITGGVLFAALFIIGLIVGPSDRSKSKSSARGDSTRVESPARKERKASGGFDLLLNITTAMTPEQVRAKVGEPHEIRKDDVQQWWIYGPDSNAAVYFIGGTVADVVTDLRARNRAEQKMMQDFYEQQ